MLTTARESYWNLGCGGQSRFLNNQHPKDVSPMVSKLCAHKGRWVWAQSKVVGPPRNPTRSRGRESHSCQARRYSC